MGKGEWLLNDLMIISTRKCDLTRPASNSWRAGATLGFWMFSVFDSGTDGLNAIQLQILRRRDYPWGRRCRPTLGEGSFFPTGSGAFINDVFSCVRLSQPQRPNKLLSNSLSARNMRFGNSSLNTVYLPGRNARKFLGILNWKVGYYFWALCGGKSA